MEKKSKITKDRDQLHLVCHLLVPHVVVRSCTINIKVYVLRVFESRSDLSLCKEEKCHLHENQENRSFYPGQHSGKQDQTVSITRSDPFWRTLAAKNARKPKRVYPFRYQCVFAVGDVCNRREWKSNDKKSKRSTPYTCNYDKEFSMLLMSFLIL